MARKARKDEDEEWSNSDSPEEEEKEGDEDEDEEENEQEGENEEDEGETPVAMIADEDRPRLAELIGITGTGRGAQKRLDRKYEEIYGAYHSIRISKKRNWRNAMLFECKFHEACYEGRIRMPGERGRGKRNRENENKWKGLLEYCWERDNDPDRAPTFAKCLHNHQNRMTTGRKLARIYGKIYADEEPTKVKGVDLERMLNEHANGIYTKKEIDAWLDTKLKEYKVALLEDKEPLGEESDIEDTPANRPSVRTVAPAQTGRRRSTRGKSRVQPDKPNASPPNKKRKSPPKSKNPAKNKKARKNKEPAGRGGTSAPEPAIESEESGPEPLEPEDVDQVPPLKTIEGNLRDPSTCMVLQIPNDFAKPSKYSFDEDPSEMNKVAVVQNGKVQLCLFHRLDAVVHYQWEYDDARKAAFDAACKGGFGFELLPNTRSYLGSKGKYNREITVLNYDEYLESPFPNVRFDPIRVAKRLLEVRAKCRKSNLLEMNQRNVWQVNFGFASAFCPDVTGCDVNQALPNPVILRPKYKGVLKNHSLVEAEAAVYLMRHLGELLDAMQDFTDTNLAANGGKPFNDRVRAECFADQFNRDTHSRKNRQAETLSINLQRMREAESETAKRQSKDNHDNSETVGSHVDKGNCERDGYNISSTFAIVFEMDSYIWRLTVILYARDSVAKFLDAELDLARPLVDEVKERVSTVNKGVRYESIKFYETFQEWTEKGAKPPVGSIISVGIAKKAKPPKDSIYIWSWVNTAELEPKYVADSLVTETVMTVWQMPSLPTPRGYLSCMVWAFDLLDSKYTLSRRQALACHYIATTTDCPLKVVHVWKNIWLKRYESQCGLPSGEELLQLYLTDCVDLNIHPSLGGSGKFSRSTPLNYGVEDMTNRDTVDMDVAEACLDFVDKWLKTAEKGQLHTETIVEKMLASKATEPTYGIGAVGLLNWFNIAAFFGLLDRGCSRAFHGWINENSGYSRRIPTSITLNSKERVIRFLAEEIGYPGDLKVAEHVACKTYREKNTLDVFIEQADHYDMRLENNGEFHFWRQKWGQSSWRRYEPRPKEEEEE